MALHIAAQHAFYPVARAEGDIRGDAGVPVRRGEPAPARDTTPSQESSDVLQNSVGYDAFGRIWLRQF